MCTVLDICDHTALGFRTNLEGGEMWGGGEIIVVFLYYNSVCSQEDLLVFVAFITMKKKQVEPSFFLFVCLFVCSVLPSVT